MWQLHPYSHPIPKAACINFGIWGRVLDVINRAKFQLDRFRGFGAQVAENRYLELTGCITLVHSVRTNVLLCAR